jgi:uncharacterized protein YciI
VLFAIHAMFKPGVEPPASLQGEFSAHLMQPVLQIHLAGPLIDAEGVRAGFLIVMEAEAEASIRRFVEDSPFTRAGLYRAVEVHRFEPEAGRI